MIKNDAKNCFIELFINPFSVSLALCNKRKCIIGNQNKTVSNTEKKLEHSKFFPSSASRDALERYQIEFLLIICETLFEMACIYNTISLC